MMRWNVNWSAISRTLRNLVCAVFSLGSLAGLSHADDRAAKLEILRRWTAEAAAIKTAKIKCFRIRIEPANAVSEEFESSEVAVETSLTSEEFRVFFHERMIPLLGRPKWRDEAGPAIEAYAKQVGRKLSSGRSELAIAQDGDKVRTNVTYPANRTFGMTFAGHSYEFNESLNAASISNSMQFTVADVCSVEDLRFALQGPVSKSDIDLMRYERVSAAENARLASPAGVIEFNTESGFVTHVTILDPADGQIYREVWQLHPRNWPGEIMMPTISARIEYYQTSRGEPRVLSAAVYVVESAEFNRMIAPTEFHVQTPKGASIECWDPMAGDEGLASRQLIAEEDIPDLAAFVMPAEKSGSQRPRTGTLKFSSPGK